MRFLTICSYLCGLSAILFGVLLLAMAFIETSDFEAELPTIMILSSVVILPGISQLFYTSATRSLYSLPPYIETNSLDDYLVNAIDSNIQVVETNFWQKIFSFVNSLLLCFGVLFMSFNITSIIETLIKFGFTAIEGYITLALCVIYLVAVPTILYNLRTYNMKRIRV